MSLMRSLYHYKINVRRVVDGDTIEIAGLDIGFGCVMFQQKGRSNSGKPTYYSIRIFGINTPETRRGTWAKGLTEEETELAISRGHAAKDYVNMLIMNDAKAVYFKSCSHGPDNFGRLLGEVFVEIDNGVETAVHNVGDLLIERKLAKPYEP